MRYPRFGLSFPIWHGIRGYMSASPGDSGRESRPLSPVKSMVLFLVAFTIALWSIFHFS